MARVKNVKYSPERERDRGQKSANITVVFLAEPVSDKKGCVLSVIVRDNSFFVLASKHSEWKGDDCGYYTLHSILPLSRLNILGGQQKKFLKKSRSCKEIQ